MRPIKYVSSVFIAVCFVVAMGLGGMYSRGAFTRTPQIHIQNPTALLGPVPIDCLAYGTFVVKNTGNAPLTIAVKSVSCSCTVAEIGAEILAPGEHTTIKAAIRAPDNEKDFGARIVISSNDPKRPEAGLEIGGAAVCVVNVNPPNLFAGSLAAEKLPIKLDFRVSAGKLGNARMLQSAKIACAASKIKINSEFKDGEIFGHAVIPADESLGILRSSITLSFDEPAGYQIKIPIIAEITGHYSASPQSFNFGNVGIGTQTALQCQITPIESGDTVDVLPVEPQNLRECIEVRTTKENGVLLNVTFSPRSEMGVIESGVKVRIRTASGNRTEYLQIPIIAVVRKPI